MNRNVEIKARATSLALQRRLAEGIATSRPTLIGQRDVFFNVPAGRLKLRIFSDVSGELIQYDRDDESRAKLSRYVVVATDRPMQMLECLTRSLGVRVEVRKIRTLYLAGRTRIHLDEVEGLGEFIELEVVLAPDEPLEAGQKEADRLMQALEIAPADLVACAYADLLLARR